MYQAQAVRIIQPLRDLSNDRANVRNIQRSTFFEQHGKVNAIQELHDQERCLPRFTRVGSLDNIWVF